MNKTFCRLACMAAIFLANSVHAEVVNFNAPELIDIDNQTLVATYSEAGFRITGVAATFLPLDFFGNNGSGGLLVFANSPIALMAAGGGAFSLLGLDYAANLFGDVVPGANLVVSGLTSGGGTLEQTLLLNDSVFTSFAFSSWSDLTQVSFVANADFVLDNINAAQQAIPEPASLALVSVALVGMALSRRRKPLR